ncbi:hypothetical protein HPB50_025279 [Hyalomma asiaticum]|uniref:Uncharacterized protein n=1 Tax=Hyalomma asiaticum TaxID=266040 RepID=A0ACB7S2I4_HYAAI|nr:hypothetical protein HPB50_025279 [Hyalomma asiaticum]
MHTSAPSIRSHHIAPSNDLEAFCSSVVGPYVETQGPSTHLALELVSQISSRIEDVFIPTEEDSDVINPIIEATGVSPTKPPGAVKSGSRYKPTYLKEKQRRLQKPDVPDDQLLSIINIEDWQILAARRIGQSEVILLTVKGATIPKEVKVGLWLTKTQRFRPRAVQCTICLTIGHRAEVCPTAHEFPRCETSGQQFPAGQQPERTAQKCELKCFNCERPHGDRDLRCPKKQQADKFARIAAEKRRLRSTPEDSAVPQKSQTSQSRTTKPTKKNNENFPSLPLKYRFSALQDTTPDPQPEPRPRSGVCQATLPSDQRHRLRHPSQ